MNSIWKKIAVLVIGYYAVIILQACCRCKDPNFRYFDYKSLVVQTDGPTEDSVSFLIRPDSIIYLSSQIEFCKKQKGVISSAMACSCKKDGYLGWRYGIKAINIYADSTFSASIPEGQPLNSLFNIRTTYNTDTKKYEYMPLDRLPGDFPMGYEVVITSKAKPMTINRPYIFKVEVVKENGEVAVATSTPIVWH